MTSNYHTSVFPKEIIDLLQLKKGNKYIDATLGGGGHSIEIVRHGGQVLGIDADQDSIDYAKQNFKFEILNSKLVVAQGNFKDIDKIADLHGFAKVSGVLYDLGVSSHQIESNIRGFSFQKEAPLDMRMDKNAPIQASDLANLLTKDELYEIFIKFGEEPRARAISSVIVSARRIKAIRTTGDLLKIIEGVYGIKGNVSEKTKASVAKRVFQAFRIAVNNELENLKESLPKAIGLLEDKGRIAVISFHSLEDRIVKESFMDFQKKNLGLIITKKPMLPSLDEIRLNRRSRSAKLRVFERRIK